MKTIKDLKYKKIKNFLTQEEAKTYADYCKIKHRLNFNSFDCLQNKNCDTFFYGDPLMESIMLNKKSIIEEESGLKLSSTYAFWRMYTKFADLKEHIDRPSCEISVSVCLGSDGFEWPLIFDGTSINLEPGDACIYLGCEIIHGREEYKGDWQAQTFLHYVDKNGPYRDWAKDKRALFGQQKRRNENGV
jgi:hypothetical protein